MKSNEEKISDANGRPVPRWTKVHSLLDFHEAPNTGGVYEIGFRLPERYAEQNTGLPLISGYGYPMHSFIPMYVGKHENSMRQRLREHLESSYSNKKKVRERVNRCIATYYNMLKFVRTAGCTYIWKALAGVNGGVLRDYTYLFSELYFTCIPLQEPDKFEGLRLGLYEYPWNDYDQPKNRERMLTEGSLDLRILSEAQIPEDGMTHCYNCVDRIYSAKVMVDPFEMSDDFNTLIADISKVRREENARRVKENAERYSKGDFNTEKILPSIVDTEDRTDNVRIGGGKKVSRNVVIRMLAGKFRREKVYKGIDERRKTK
ncbi:hypothetical protein ACJJIF_19060 [Microbulbifer sp. SSSA002]|uniref:hypothetical protein n=1 Tax=Microbulbifer sp. SSSA002 TaxID=3243376 RepID=UPI004039089E